MFPLFLPWEMTRVVEWVWMPKAKIHWIDLTIVITYLLGITLIRQGKDPMDDLTRRIESFLESGPYAVVGASRNRSKYGNKVLRAYLQHELLVYPVNPYADEVERLRAYPNLHALPEMVRAVSIITPPDVTGDVIDEAVELGIEHAWLQPGAESEHAIAAAEEAGINVIAGGPCLLVVLGYRET